MIFNQFKTALLLATLSGLLFLCGYYFGGMNGLYFAFMMSLCMNFVTYYMSDKIVLKMYGATPLSQTEYPHIHDMVHELADNARIPVPKLWYIKTSMANAFATGRNPKHASVAVTQGILDILDEDELRGVLAHELAHVKNRDILVGTVAATLATAIGYLAHMLRWSLILGGRGGRDRNNGLGTIFLIILMPIAAMLIQLAITRSREYLADESGAKCSNDPLALASALEKLHTNVREHKLQPDSPAHASTASLFIVYPFSGGSWANLFSTHPPMEKRIQRLRKMAH